MSRQPMRSASLPSNRPPDEGENIKGVLQRAGIRPTAQRLALCRHILGESRHLTVQDLRKWADDHFPQISLATIYNTLHTLVEAGLVRALKIPQSDKVIYDSNIDFHYHFLDEKTGELTDLPPEQIRIHPRLKKGYSIRGIDVLIRGVRD